MEGLVSKSAAFQYIADCLAHDKFTVVDVGCSGGIDAIWRGFGARLTAFGFDPNVDECSRLNASETLPGVKYIPGFVGLPQDDPIVKRRGSRPYVQRSLGLRLSSERTQQIRQARQPSRPAEELTADNLWTNVALADPAKPIVLSRFFRDHALDDIDLIKIDVDGPDFDILQSLSDSLASRHVLALGLEVNFIGSADDTDHTFCNTDRFMRAHGFDLFALTVRPYSMAALPSPYRLNVPWHTEFGRPVQGDAVYARDLGNPDVSSLAAAIPPPKLAKLAAIFTAIGLVDCAAEVFLTHRERLGALLDIDRMLDLLSKEAQNDRATALSYRDYMAAFERDDPMFYVPRREFDIREKAFAQARSLPLATMKPGAPGSSLRAEPSGLSFRSAPAQWTYIGRMPLSAGTLRGGGWVAADVRVTKGTLSVGVLNRGSDDFLANTVVGAGDDAARTVFLRVNSFAGAGDLVLQNGDKEAATEGTLEAVRVAAEAGDVAAGTTTQPGRGAVLPLQTLRPENGGELSLQNAIAMLTTPAQQWAYAASAPLPEAEDRSGPGIVRVRLQVVEGMLGIGVTSRADDGASQMLAEQPVDVTDAPIEVEINVEDLAQAGFIVFRSWSPGDTKVRARISSLESLAVQGPSAP